ncbi:MAG: type IV secretion system DNA-binding domain-containing protein [Treponema sp.]|nr:type IV secretion system DNA-binding domain-containing protein [Treponema sp.]
MDDINILDGYLVKATPEMNIIDIERKLSSDDILKKGLLFAGSARQGKTNVMMKITSDIIYSLNCNDVMVILDVKGDYKKSFYQTGDIILSPTDDTFLWNIFDELKIIPFGNELDNRVRETVEYFFYGLESAREPFGTNAAKIITYCLIMYLLLEADSRDDDSNLNHYELCKLIDGVTNDNSTVDAYENYRQILNSYTKFKVANLFLPPLDSGMMGPSVITEIIVMRQRMFVATFGEKIKKRQQAYITPGIIPKLTGSKIIFLEFNQRYRKTCIPVFRYFVDMLIAEYTGSEDNHRGRLFLMLDELAILPELNNLSFALSLGAGLGIRVIATLQEIEQIKNNYQEHPHNAEVLIGAFQSQIIFNSDINTIEYFQRLFGKALVQRIFIKPGGGIGYTEPVSANTIETHEIQTLYQFFCTQHRPSDYNSRKFFISFSVPRSVYNTC